MSLACDSQVCHHGTWLNILRGADVCSFAARHFRIQCILISGKQEYVSLSVAGRGSPSLRPRGPVSPSRPPRSRSPEGPALLAEAPASAALSPAPRFRYFLTTISKLIRSWSARRLPPPLSPKRPRQDDPPARSCQVGTGHRTQPSPRLGIEPTNCETKACMLIAMLQHRFHTTLHCHTHHTSIREGSSIAPLGKASGPGPSYTYKAAVQPSRGEKRSITITHSMEKRSITISLYVETRSIAITPTAWKSLQSPSAYTYT